VRGKKAEEKEESFCFFLWLFYFILFLQRYSREPEPKEETNI
jgi:hypothetical protein